MVVQVDSRIAVLAERCSGALARKEKVGEKRPREDTWSARREVRSSLEKDLGEELVL